MASFVITNARIVDGGSVTEGDVLVRHDRIARVDGRVPIPGGAAVIDAAGRYLLPGMIDAQVHFREPGAAPTGDMASESAAAVAGGITTFFDMPNVDPPTTTREALAGKYARAAEVARANFGFYFGASADGLDELASLTPGEACGVAINLGGAVGSPVVDDPRALERILERSPLLAVAHGQDPARVAAAEQRVRRGVGDGVTAEFHPEIRDVASSVVATRRVVELARGRGAPLHVLAVSSEEELAACALGRDDGEELVSVGLGVAPVHFSAGDYARLGMALKTNPPIRDEVQRGALLDGLRRGRISLLASDHAPHLRASKSRTYFDVPAGLPLVQDALPMLLEQVARGVLSIETVVERFAHAPARRFAIAGRGYVREGHFADLVLVDLRRETVRTDDEVLSRCGWSPVEGEVLRGRVVSTWVNGALAYDGRRVIDVRAGRRVEHDAVR